MKAQPWNRWLRHKEGAMDEGGRSSVAESGKRAIKRGLQLVVSTLGRPVWWFPQGSLVVLTYHRVLPDGHPDWQTMQPGMVVSARTLELHLEILREHFTLIHLGEWLRRARTGRSLPPRACALTFDDGWRDGYETVYPILRRAAAPATLFLVSDYLDTTRRFWPERLSDALSAATRADPGWTQREFDWLHRLGLRPGTTPDVIIGAAKVLPDEMIEEHLDGMEARLGSNGAQNPAALMSWEQTRQMVSDGLVEAGSHTCTHYRLGHAHREVRLLREIAGSRRQLEERLDRPVDLFCYPNGETTEAAERMVRANYLAACTTVRGWNDREQDHHRLRRIGMHDGVSADYHAFLARLSGWM